MRIDHASSRFRGIQEFFSTPDERSKNWSRWIHRQRRRRRSFLPLRVEQQIKREGRRFILLLFLSNLRKSILLNQRIEIFYLFRLV